MKPESRNALAFWAVALPLLALTRAPYLGSPFHVLDNDEAVLGIMARRLASGVEFPLFFAGQGYGLAIFETAPLALSFGIFGESTEVVASTMFVLFCVGLVAYARAFEQISGSASWGRVLAVAVALLPGWIVWSLKARGIYVSGFMITGLTLALLSKPDLTRAGLLGAGLLMGLVGIVQPLWLSLSMPFLVLVRRPVRELVATALTSLTIWILPTALGPGGDAFWNPRPIDGFVLERLGFLPEVLLRTFSGRDPPHEPGVSATLVGVAAALAFFGLICVMAWEAGRRRSRSALVVAVAMCASILHIVLLRVWVPRYFLPSTVLAAVAVATYLGSRGVAFRGGARTASVALVVTLALVALRVGAVREDSTLAEVPAEDDLETLIASLEEDGVRGVYAQTSDVQWQLLFYGKERIPTRGVSRDDRYPHFPAAVDSARRSGAPTAYVADVRQLRRDLPIDSFPGYRVGERYLRLDDPNVMLLVAMGFQTAREVGTP